jgi:hypothetical protein
MLGALGLVVTSVAAADGGGSGSSGSGSGSSDGRDSDDGGSGGSGSSGGGDSTTSGSSSRPGPSTVAAPGGHDAEPMETSPGAAVAPPAAKAKTQDASVSSRCGAGVVATLRLQANGRVIRVRFEIEHDRPGARWQIAVVHERRLAWKGAARASSPTGWLGVERRIGDFPGSDAVSVRAWGPGGAGCQATASVDG